MMAGEQRITVKAGYRKLTSAYEAGKPLRSFAEAIGPKEIKVVLNFVEEVRQRVGR